MFQKSLSSADVVADSNFLPVKLEARESCDTNGWGKMKLNSPGRAYSFPNIIIYSNQTLA